MPEPKASPKPAGVKVGVPPKKVKTERELKDEAFLKKHEKVMSKLNEEQAKVEKYLEFLCKRVDLQRLTISLNIPIDGEQSMILPQSFFNRVDREFVTTSRMLFNKAAVEDSDQLTVSQEEMENIGNVHHYALFEALNEALD